MAQDYFPKKSCTIVRKGYGIVNDMFRIFKRTLAVLLLNFLVAKGTSAEELESHQEAT